MNIKRKDYTNFVTSPSLQKFSAIVYIAVRIHVMFDYMNHNIGFFHAPNLLVE